MRRIHHETVETVRHGAGRAGGEETSSGSVCPLRRPASEARSCSWGMAGEEGGHEAEARGSPPPA